jgi:hypothetical protein
MNMKMASERKLMKLWKELWAHHVGASHGNYVRGCRVESWEGRGFSFNPPQTVKVRVSPWGPGDFR